MKKILTISFVIVSIIVALFYLSYSTRENINFIAEIPTLLYLENDSTDSGVVVNQIIRLAKATESYKYYAIYDDGDLEMYHFLIRCQQEMEGNYSSSDDDYIGINTLAEFRADMRLLSEAFSEKNDITLDEFIRSYSNKLSIIGSFY